MITAPSNMKDESLKSRIATRVANKNSPRDTYTKTMKDEYTHYDLVKYFGTLEG